MRAKQKRVFDKQKSVSDRQNGKKSITKYLYIDNFRGFENTFVPIEDVNFFVGDNSTGKSSILGLLKLLSTPYFWLRGSFNSDEVSFGNFNDIVSINSPNRKYFSVGYIEQIRVASKKAPSLSAFLFTFYDRDGIPQPEMHIFAKEGTEMRIRYAREQISMKSRSISENSDMLNFMRRVFPAWVKAHKNDKTGYRNLVKKRGPISNFPPAIIAYLAGNIKKKQLPEKESFVFSDQFILPKIPGGELVWFGPIRTKPIRTYDEYKLEFSSEGAHTPYLIKNLLRKKAGAKNFKKFLRQIGRDSGLFEMVKTRDYAPGATAPFELDVILNNKALSVSNVGYGVSQVLPVIVEAFVRPKGSWFGIQQPEIHLHPKAQAALGDIIFDLAVTDAKRFFVETHSDYTIDRFRLNYNKKSTKTKPESQILYFERTQKGNRIYQIKIGDNGELPSDQPPSYRNFFLRENLRLLEL